MLGYFIFLVVYYYTPPVQGQSNGDLRLVGSGNGGRLEIYLTSQSGWGTVCNDEFDVYEGDVACRQLGYLYADRVGTVGSLGYSSASSGTDIFLDDVSCSSSATRLIDCSINFFDNCNHSEDIALLCSNSLNQVRLVSNSGSRTSSLSSGRFEIYINNRWGTICNNSFTKTDADVACNQLGSPESNAFTSSSQLGFNQVFSSTLIWLSNIICTSDTPSNNIRQCSHSGTGLPSASCSHSNDVILSCRESGNLRLVRSSSSSTTLVSSGRLEIYLNGEWGTVCDDFFHESEAYVACRQLGFTDYDTYGKSSSLGFGRGLGSIWLDDLSCSSLEMTLLDCRHGGIGIENCVHSEDVGLVCTVSSTPSSTPSPPTLDTGSDVGLVCTVSSTPSSTPSPPTLDTGSGSSVGIVIGSIVVSLAFGGGCFMLLCVGGIFAAVSSGNRRRHRNIIIPPPHTTTVTTTSTRQAPPQAVPYPVQGYSATRQHPPATYPTAQPYPPPDSKLQEAPPPSYAMAMDHRAFPPPPPPPPQALYPLSPQAPPASYPQQETSPYPNQGQPTQAHPPINTTGCVPPYPPGPPHLPQGYPAPPTSSGAEVSVEDPSAPPPPPSS